MSMVKVMKIDEWLEKKSIEKDAIIFKDQNWTFSHLKKIITKTSLFLQNECQLKVGDRFFTPANKISKSKSIRSKFGSKGFKKN